VSEELQNLIDSSADFNAHVQGVLKSVKEEAELAIETNDAGVMAEVLRRACVSLESVVNASVTVVANFVAAEAAQEAKKRGKPQNE
jgi:hypothetical protein